MCDALVLTGDSSYISGNLNSPFWCKERFCDSVSFGIIPSSVQKCRVLFQNWTELKLYLISGLMSFKEGNKLIELKENEKSTNVFTRNISQQAALKLVMS